MREHAFFRSFLFALLACALAALWLLAVLAAGGLPEAKGAPAPAVGRRVAVPVAGPAPATPVGCWRWGAYWTCFRPGGGYCAAAEDGRLHWVGRWRLDGGRLFIEECQIDPHTHCPDAWGMRYEFAWPGTPFTPAQGPFPPLPVAGQAGVQ